MTRSWDPRPADDDLASPDPMLPPEPDDGYAPGDLSLLESGFDRLDYWG